MEFQYEHILNEDRQQANKSVSVWMHLMSAMVFFIWALGFLQVFHVSTWLFHIAIPASGIALLIPKLCDIFLHLSDVKSERKNGNQILAWLNIICSFASIFLLSCCLSPYIMLAWCFPLLVACQYSAKKMTVVSYILGLCGLCVSHFVCMYLGAWDFNMMPAPALIGFRHLNLYMLENGMLYLLPKAFLYIITFPLFYSISKRGELLLKMQRLSIMAHQAKLSLDAMSEFPDTFETDCRIKIRYLAKNNIDVDAALKAMDQNIEKYNDFVLTFVGESHRKEDELFSLLDPDTLLQYGAKVHALRIKANALGLKNLTDTAFFHEMEAYAGNYEIVMANWEKLSFEWDEAYELFTDYIQSLGLRNHAYDKSGHQITFQEWGEQLQEAFEALDAYDTTRARNILNHLLQYQIDADINQKLASIVANIDDILKA